MKRIFFVFLLCCAPFLSCMSARIVPSPDPGMKDGVLAYRVHFAHKGIFGSLLGTDEEVTLRYVRAARIENGCVVKGSEVTTEIVSGWIAFFAGVEPGEYVITDIVFAKTVGGAGSRGGISQTDGTVKFIVAELPDADRMKTSAKAEAGTVKYGGRFAVRADSAILSIIPDFDSKKMEKRRIAVNKGFAPSRNSADDIIPATSVTAVREDNDAAYFSAKAAAVLAGSGWEKAPVVVQ